MISDKEMILAFMGDDESGFFHDNYPRLIESESALFRYNELKLTIGYNLAMYLACTDSTYIIPDWVYSYMIGSTISVNSDYLDIHDLCVQLGISQSVDVFSAECSQACLDVSLSYLGSASMNDVMSIPDNYKDDVESILRDMSLYDWYHFEGDKIRKRPPTLFGEPHIIKTLRLRQSM
jgi:hypothetical protein